MLLQKTRKLQKDLQNRVFVAFYVEIPINITRKLREYLHRDIETAGNLIVQTHFTKYVDNNYVALLELGLDPKCQITGTSTSVTQPISEFNFHTHPYHCYRDQKCALGWPSNEDMVSIFRMRMAGNIVHFVITVEGIYGVQLTLDFQKYMDLCDKHDVLSKIEQLIFDYLAPLNSGRIVNPLVAHLQLDRYIFKINSITMKDILMSAQGLPSQILSEQTDFTLYRVSFTDWTTIESGNKTFSMKCY